MRWFHVAANASCVFLSWSLVCEQPLLLSFVLEWLELSGDSSQGRTSVGRVEWLRVASTARDLQLCRKFVTFTFVLKYFVAEITYNKCVTCLLMHFCGDYVLEAHTFSKT